jgi:hypothetical protein
MNSTSTWERVSKRRPCPVCTKPDWCMYASPEDSPTAVICARVESPKRCGESGWLHVLRNDGPTWTPWRRSIRVAVRMMSEPVNGKVDFAKLAADSRQGVKPEALDKLAVSLGVSIESLRRLGVGWSAQHRAWSFPMSNAAGGVLGIRAGGAIPPALAGMVWRGRGLHHSRREAEGKRVEIIGLRVAG